MIMETHYYLLNGTVKKGKKMPERQDYKLKITFEASYNDWKDSLQPCEISESELGLVIGQCTMTGNANNIFTGNKQPIDITDIVFDKDGKIYFKQPTEKNVESECEAVEFYKWIATLTPTSNENCFNKIRDGYYRIKPPMELYEIFKNR